MSEKGARGGDGNKRSYHELEIRDTDQTHTTASDTPEVISAQHFPTLTQTALNQHTQMQEKLYIKQARTEIELLLKNRSKKHKQLKLQTKNSTLKDVCGKQLHTSLQKREKPSQNNSGLLKSSKSVSQLTTSHKEGSKHAASCQKDMGPTSNSMGSLRSSRKLSHCGWKQSSKSSLRAKHSQPKNSKNTMYLPWFFYPQKGIQCML